ncbi:MAG: hypothetical protein WCP91_02785, partial [Candidatus Berkelbacteria bacterium]
GDRADSSVRSDKTTIFDKDWWISKDDLISGINVHKQNNLYRDYYFADGYNFNEPKVFLQNDKHMLDTPTTVAMTGDELRQFSPVVGGATYMFFLPHFSWQVTPLAIRHDVDSGYPIISESLFRTMHQLQSTVNKKTEITISGTLTVLSGGRINVNGKGFAPSLFTSGTQINYGAGPAAGWGGYHQTTPAGSHAGFGGYQTDISVLYDSALLNEPILPGSAGGYSAMDMNCAYATSSYGGFGGPYDRVCHRGIDNYESFGGGFISISAKSVNLASGSAVTANAVGGNTDHPAPGGAGGSIILKDADSGSQYGGAIEAMGAGIREASGDSHARTNSGGGGGGNIYIATSVAPTSTLTSAENTVIAPAIQLDNWFWDNRPAADFASLKISVSGGDTETGIKGSPGIINIVGSQPPMAGIHKIIDKIEPLDGTSPYNLKPADKIRITLHVTNLVVGQPITIRDEFFNDGTVAGISKFSLIVGSNDCKTHIGGGSVDLSSCTMTPTTSDIAWTFTPAAGQETVDLQYSLLVK